jgi:threonine dehydrogenase-like Zn-dependent dehydrogenase
MVGQLAALVGRAEVVVKEFPIPDPEPGALVVRIRRANICGTEVHRRRGDFNLCQRGLACWSQPPEHAPLVHGAFSTHYYIPRAVLLQGPRRAV